MSPDIKVYSYIPKQWSQADLDSFIELLFTGNPIKESSNLASAIDDAIFALTEVIRSRISILADGETPSGSWKVTSNNMARLLNRRLLPANLRSRGLSSNIISVLLEYKDTSSTKAVLQDIGDITADPSLLSYLNDATYFVDG